jgi:hypothetical protein
MVPTEKIEKRVLPCLPVAALLLISEGLYSLYEITSNKIPSAKYVLRTGMKDFYFLSEKGKEISLRSSEDFQIKSKILLTDVKPPLSICNSIF